MDVFEAYKRKNSVSIAKDRLKTLLVSDRMNCTPDQLEKVQLDLYKTLSKYMDVSKEFFDVEITRSQINISLTGEKS